MVCCVNLANTISLARIHCCLCSTQREHCYAHLGILRNRGFLTDYQLNGRGQRSSLSDTVRSTLASSACCIGALINTPPCTLQCTHDLSLHHTGGKASPSLPSTSLFTPPPTQDLCVFTVVYTCIPACCMQEAT